MRPAEGWETELQWNCSYPPQQGHGHYISSIVFVCHLQNVGNWPLAYNRQPSTMSSDMVKRRKQIQPRSGVERAFGQVVRTIRTEELNISQAELEKRTGLNRTFISDLERGIQGPGIRTLLRIAKGLETTPCSLIRRTTRSKFFEFPAGREVI